MSDYAFHRHEVYTLVQIGNRLGVEQARTIRKYLKELKIRPRRLGNTELIKGDWILDALDRGDEWLNDE